MSQLVVDLGLVDLYLRVPSSGPAAQPHLPNLPSAREEFGRQGNSQNPMNPTQVYDQLGRPVDICKIYINLKHFCLSAGILVLNSTESALYCVYNRGMYPYTSLK